MKRLLVTGAAGRLGSLCRRRLAHLAGILRLSDSRELAAPAAHEELVTCELGDRAAVTGLVEGCDGVVHLGGKRNDGPWDDILDANIRGVFNLYEACRVHGVRRIFLASSNHVVGFHPRNHRLDAGAPPRPDGLYAASKIFGEAVASVYHDKFGIETACVRIGSCFPAPRDHRMLSTWLSHDDFIRLVECVFSAPRLGCPVIYGVSDNNRTWWDNHLVEHLDWHPRDNAEAFRSQLDSQTSALGRPAAGAGYQGGVACELGIEGKGQVPNIKREYGRMP